MPPPASYPLRPRPRASEYLRRLCDNFREGKGFTLPIPRTPHQIAGPPYSLLLVDKPDSTNAFSYGFGPNGGGGIVVYSGFLDEIFARMPMNTSPPTEEPKSWYISLFRALFSSPPRHPTPTPEQTAQLATLLAHELSHLVLSHHLESLSSATVILPGVISIMTDAVRVLLFPITMLFGPFVNDAVAQLGKVGSGELVKMGELCTTSVVKEIEADVVSARLLAHAGFDVRDAVRYWENQSSNSKPVDCGTNTYGEPSLDERLAMALWGQAHPVNELRADALRQEIARWEDERRRQVAVSKERKSKENGR
ncbi:hypothetical protein C0992_003075 [Termitomyces sp. T32_za158]|nr:hypothetical protein C0992_003075 [Termitomyces sp. T32_za158]